MNKYSVKSLLNQICTMRQAKQFRDITVPYTPPELIEHIMADTNLAGGDAIGVLYSVEVLLYLREHGFDNVVMITVECDPLVSFFADLLGYKYMPLDKVINTNMKFKLIIGNPPFQDGSLLLYTRFFEQSLDIADDVRLLMPTNLMSKAPKLKAHNALVEKHSTFISLGVNKQYFGVGVGEVRYVCASLSQVNRVPRAACPLASYIPKCPSRNRIFPRRGQNLGPVSGRKDPAGIDCITGLYRDGARYEKINSERFKLKKSMVTSAPWLLLICEHPSLGRFNTAVIKNDGVKWGSGMFALDCSTKNEAEKLEEWLTSDEIVKEVNILLHLKDTHSFSGAMAGLLPWYC